MNRVKRIAKVNRSVNALVTNLNEAEAPPALVGLIHTVFRPFAVAVDDAQSQDITPTDFQIGFAYLAGYMITEMSTRMVPRDDKEAALDFVAKMVEAAAEVAMDQIGVNYAERQDQATSGIENVTDDPVRKPH